MTNPQNVRTIAIALITIGLLEGGVNAADIIIDSFTENFTTNSDLQIDSPSLGGETDVSFFFKRGTASSANGRLTVLGTDPIIEGHSLSFRLDWDGVDDSQMIDQSGLGGTDLTDSGSNSGFKLSIESFTGDPQFLIVLRSPDHSSGSYPYSTISSTGDIFVPFSDVIAWGGSDAVDLRSVGAISLFFELDFGDEISISEFAVTGAPEPHIHGIDVIGDQIEVEFSDVLQWSEDLLDWQDVDPQPTSPYRFIPNHAKMFFRPRRE